MQYVPENLKQIESLIVCNSVLNFYFEEIEAFDPDLCSQSDVLVRAQFDAHARLFSVVLSLTSMSTDIPH